MQIDKSKVEARFKSLKAEATSWQSAWKDLVQYIRPTRGFFDAIPNQGTSIDHKKIISSHAMRAIRTLSAGMMSGLTSPSRPWFKLSISDPEFEENQSVKLWLEDIQKRMNNVFSKSNLYSLFPTVYEEIALTGTSATLILEDYDDVILGKTFTVGEYYLGIGKNSKVNAFAREYFQTVSALIDEFGPEYCSQQTRTCYTNGEKDKFVKCYHLIEPNLTRENQMVDNRNMPFRSIYWEDGSASNEILRISGFEEFPLLTPRWDTTCSSDIYGKGPGWDALGDAKMLQKMSKDTLTALDKVVDPPVQVNSATVQINMLPGGVTRYSDTAPNAGVKPSYQIAPDFNAVINLLNMTKEDISKTFYVDLFLMLSNIDRANITAREVIERHEEKLLQLGPVLERLEGEFLKPLINRTFNIMVRNNLLPMPPDELQGKDIKVEFISVLAQAQKMVGTSGINQLVGFVSNVAPIMPEILDTIDMDQAVIEYGDMVGVSPKIVRDKDTIDEIRKNRQEQEKELQMQQNLQGSIQAAKTLADTDTSGQNALTDLTKQMSNNQTQEGI